MGWKVLIVAIVVLVFLMTLAILYGAKRWQSDTGELYAKLDAARVPIAPESYDPRELENLPPPVQRYFRAVLKEGQPLIAAVSVEQTGTFNMSETGERWKPFTSTQRIITRRPGFVWDARIRMAPAMTAFVHDAYVAGEGVLTAKLFGFLTVMEQSATPELAQGELMRFFAEAAWYPTALLPSQGVQWESVDDASARATLKDGQTTLTMLFRFAENGLIESVRAEARGRIVAGAVIPTPWEGRWSNYERHDGMRIPIEGEVMWMLPEGPKPYWRGRITRLRYEFAQ
ncbi:hypothetical protein BMS3Abin05_00051 [bacterium BMS3Abin05]|nr:hypothetical protein BMS3Abin05_00051 [bacterium BMS3Abin05]HDZ12967.1 hypothetical protein [Bacteroidota bacterium]